MVLLNDDRMADSQYFKHIFYLLIVLVGLFTNYIFVSWMVFRAFLENLVKLRIVEVDVSYLFKLFLSASVELLHLVKPILFRSYFFTPFSLNKRPRATSC
jgi:hypothetical protein